MSCHVPAPPPETQGTVLWTWRARPLLPLVRPSSCLSTLSCCICIGPAERAHGGWARSAAPSGEVALSSAASLSLSLSAVCGHRGDPGGGRSQMSATVPPIHTPCHRQEGRGRASSWDRGPFNSQSCQEDSARGNRVVKSVGSMPACLGWNADLPLTSCATLG